MPPCKNTARRKLLCEVSNLGIVCWLQDPAASIQATTSLDRGGFGVAYDNASERLEWSMTG